jgi:predicted kinase
MEVVIFVGLQASGKSSFYRARFAETHEHVSMDNFRNNRSPRDRQLVLLEEALRAGRPVVIDNTNPTAEDRLPLIRKATELGARVVGYYFESRLPDCVERNRGRLGRSRVPDLALYATGKRLRRPALGEGFTQLFHVRMDGNGGWEVSEWLEAAEAPGEGRP